jgi:hypothetical protein
MLFVAEKSWEWLGAWFAKFLRKFKNKGARGTRDALKGRMPINNQYYVEVGDRGKATHEVYLTA